MNLLVKILKDYSDFFFSILIALFGIILFYPGSMTGDSIDQWRQVLEPETISNWFPPTMVYLWIAVNRLSFGPQGMLILHYFTYSLSIFLLGRTFYSHQKDRILYLLIGIFPATFLTIGIIWKDVSMLVSIIMSISLLFLYEKNKRNLLLLASLIFFIYGVSVRHNAIFCSLPFFLYLFWTTIRADRFYRVASSVTLTLIATIILHSSSGYISTYKIHPAFRYYNIENSIFIWDLWGMSVRLNKNIIPNYVFQDEHNDLSMDFLKKHYKPHSNTVIWLHEYLNKDWRRINFPDKKFKEDFIEAIWTYPSTYLKTRFDIMPYMLGIKKTYIYMPYLFYIQNFHQTHYLYKYSSQLETKNFWFKKLINIFANYLYQETIIFDVWLYLAIGILLFLYFIFDKQYRHQKRAILILSMGLIYWLPYFFITTSSEYRYSVFTILCTLITLPLFFSSVLEKFRSKKRGTDHVFKKPCFFLPYQVCTTLLLHKQKCFLCVFPTAKFLSESRGKWPAMR